MRDRLELNAPVNFILAVILFILANTEYSLAQSGKRPLSFSSINEIGLLTGEKGEALLLQTVNGVAKGRSFAGLGVGLDYYDTRSIPLYLHYRWHFSSNKNTPFLYSGGGFNFAWFNAAQKVQWDVSTSSPGYFYDLGAGWKLSGKNGRGWVLSAGYTVKQVLYKTPFYSIFAPTEMEGESYNRFNLIFRRLAVKIGLQL